MKNLKVKLGLFSLLTVLAVSIFFTSCEQDVLAPENIVDTGEILTLDFTSPENMTEPPKSPELDFIDIEYNNETVLAFDGNDNIEKSFTLNDNIKKSLTLNGKFDVTSTGNVSGKVEAKSSDNLINGEVEIKDFNMVYSTNEGSVTVNLTTMQSLVIDKSGIISTIDLHIATDQLISLENTYKPLDLEYQAIYAFMAVLQNKAWLTNANISTDEINLRGCSFAENALAWSAGGAVAAIAFVGCGSLAAGCAAGTAPTLGAITVPCAYALPACAAVGAGGTAAAVDIIKGWLCEDEECFAPNNMQFTYHGNNLYCITYNGPNGGSNRIHYWNGSYWAYWTSTSDESFCFYVNPGWNYIGLSATCSNGTTTTVQNYLSLYGGY